MKLVIIPNFGESHLIKLQIPNLVRTLQPDIVIYNEGLFPTGPESCTFIDDKFRDDFCCNGTNLAWDTQATQNYIHQAKIDYPDITWIHNEMEFSDNASASQAYLEATSNWADFGIEVKKGDFIFPLEPDVFHLDDSYDEINGYLGQLQPDSGFKSIWIDFLETQYYTEKVNHPSYGKPKERKIGICFGTMDFYKSVMLNFQSQNYSNLYPTDLVTYHYNWFRYGKYKELRFRQIVRKNPQYWIKFEEGLQQIRNFSISGGLREDVEMRNGWDGHLYKYASYIDIEHPSSIKQHPNWIK